MEQYLSRTRVGINANTGDSKHGCSGKDIKKFYEAFEENAKLVSFQNFNLGAFYHWIDQMDSPKREFTICYIGRKHQYQLKLYNQQRKLVCINGNGNTKKEQIYSIVKQLFGEIKQQMMEGSPAHGAGTQEEEKATTTILTADTGLESCDERPPPTKSLNELCNTEMTFEMKDLTDRWEILESGQISVDEDFSRNYYLPRDLFIDKKKLSANLLLFKNFIYTQDLELEMRVIVNAPKFGQGRMIIGRFPDPFDGIDWEYRTAASIIQRPHVFLDLTDVNQVSILIPKEFRKTFVRNKEHESSHGGAQYGSMAVLQIAMLSKYRAPAEQPSKINFTVMYKFKSVKFAGVSYGVNMQMDKMVELAGDIYPPIKLAEKYLKRSGIIHNQDKPYDASKTSMIPVPRVNFCSGVGLSDAIPLTMDPMSTITTLMDHLGCDDPKTIYAITSKWGIYGSFEWSQSDEAGKLIWSSTVSPTMKPTLKDGRMKNRPTPINYISSGYAFWRGTIKFKFQFISTPFHTGTIQIQIGFGRSDTSNFDASNEYTKTFDLGMVKETEVTVPYIYDTPWRRTTNIQFPTGLESTIKNTFYNPWPLSTEMVSMTSIKIRVINPLLPISNVMSKIECIVLIASGDDFQLRSIVPNPFNQAYGLLTYIPYDTLPCFGDNPFITEYEKAFRTVPRVQAEYTAKTAAVSFADVKLQADFGNGPNNVSFHTTDNDTDIKTVMRRNYLVNTIKFSKDMFGEFEQMIDSNKKVRGTRHYWLPITMPNILRANTYNCATSNPLFVHGSIFRHWRGSMRFTLVVTKTSGLSPIEISYVPNVGIKHIGYRELVLETLDGDQWKTIVQGTGNMSEYGFATELLCPSINITCSVSVPFDVDFNKCVTIERMMNETNHYGDIFAREDCTDFSGHLVIRAPKDTYMDVYMSVGDDFDLHTFIGTPRVDVGAVINFPDSYSNRQEGEGTGITNKNNIVGSVQSAGVTLTTMNKMKKRKPWDFLISESHLSIVFHPLMEKSGIRLQMFNPLKEIKESMQNISEVSKKVDERTEALTSKLSLAIDQHCENLTATTSKLNENQDNITQNIASVSENVNRVTSLFGENSKKINQFIDSMLSKFNSMIPDNLSAMGKQIAQFSTNLIFDLVILLKDFSMSTFAIMIVKYIAQIFFINYTQIMEWVEKLTKLLKKKVGFASQQNKSGDKPAQSLFGFFCSMIATFCKFELSPNKKFYDYGSKFNDFVFDVKNVNYLNGVMSLVERVTGTMISAVTWMANRKQIVPTMKEYFVENESKLATFMQNVDDLTNPANKHILNRPDIKAKCFTTFLEAKAIRQKTCTMPGNQSANALNTYCNRMLKFTEEKWSTFSCCPVRMEPRVICFSGPSNIGKSFMAEHFAMEMLNAIGYKALGANPIFTRNPGRKHWDGYNDQPVILFDDWMNLKDTESLKEQISDLYELKSTCDFMPAMASLIDKGVRGNPRLVLTLTNDAFPESIMSCAAVHPEAVFRRRDLVIEVKKVGEIDASQLRSNNIELTKPSFNHLQFAVVNNQRRTPTHEPRNWQTWDEIVSQLKQDFVTYWNEEKKIAKQRLDIFCADLPPQIKDMADPLATFQYRAAMASTDSIDELPSSLLERELAEVMKNLTTIYDENRQQGFFSKIAEKIRSKPQVNLHDLPLSKRQSLFELMIMFWYVRQEHESEKKNPGTSHFRYGKLFSQITEDLNGNSLYVPYLSIITGTTGNIDTMIAENRKIAMANHVKVADKRIVEKDGVMVTIPEVWIQRHWKEIKPMKWPMELLEMMVRITREQLDANILAYEEKKKPVVEIEVPDHIPEYLDEEKTQRNLAYNEYIWSTKNIKRYEKNLVYWDDTGRNAFDPFINVDITYDNMLDALFSVPMGYRVKLTNMTTGKQVSPREIDPWDGVRTYSITLVDDEYRWDDDAIYLAKPEKLYDVVKVNDKYKIETVDERTISKFLAQAEFRWDKVVNFCKKNNLTFNLDLIRHQLLYPVYIPIVPVKYQSGNYDVPMECSNPPEFYTNGIRNEVLYREASSNAEFLFDSIVAKRDFLEINRVARKNLGERIQSECLADDSLAERLAFKNVHVFDGIQMKDFYQEMLDPSVNNYALSSLLNCHHCHQPNLIQFGNDEHHVCSDCKITSECAFCASGTVNEGLRLKQFWYVLRYGVSCSNIVKFFKWLAQKIPKSVYKIIKTSLWAFFVSCGYAMGIMAGLAGFCALYDSNTTQADVLFDGKIFTEMINQRENYEDVDMCLHHEALDLTEASYANLIWTKQTMDKPYVISVFPCKRNCKLFVGDNMEKYKLACHRYALEHTGTTHDSFAEIARNPALCVSVMVQIPPFMRDYPSNRLACDKFETERSRKYRQLINRAINGVYQVVGANPTTSALKLLAKIGGALMGAILAMRGLYSLFTSIFGKKEEKPTPPQQQTEAAYNPAPRHFYEERTQVKKATIGNHQQNSDDFTSVLYIKLAKNTLNINVYRDGNFVNTLVGIGVRDRLVCLPKHYVNYMREAKKLNLTFKLKRPYFHEVEVGYVFDEVDFKHSDISDLSIFFAPKTINMFTNITTYLAKHGDFSNSIPRSGQLFRGATYRNPQPIVHNIKLYGFKKEIKLVDSDYDCLQHVLHYNYSEDGACGSFVMKCNNHRPILGMHVAGSSMSKINPDGYAVVLYQEMFDGLDGYGIVDLNDELEDNVATSKTFFPDGVKLQVLNVHPQSVHLPSKTKIKPSWINEYDGKPQTKPAFLTKYDAGYPHEVSPLVAGCAKHGQLTENFSTSALNEVTDALWLEKYAAMEPAMADPRRLTMKQSITGMNVDGYEQLKIDTSAGMPFVLTDQKQKKDYINISDDMNREERKVEIRESALDHLLEMEQLRFNGVRPFLPYVDELKDERKKEEKRMKLGGTRVFCMSPLSTTLAVRSNFLHFAVAYKNNRLKLQHAVGISRDGPEWTALGKHLLQMSNNIITLDYSNFGPGYNAGVNACAHEILMRWTKKYVAGVSDVEMQILGEEHYNSVHIMGNLVYRQLSGGPSGDALTVVKNGLVNELYLLLAWKYLIGQTNQNADLFKTYFENVRAVCFGDDVIMAVSDEYIEQYNGETISEFFSSYGIVATDAEKSGKLVKCRKLHESSFLKSGFMKHPSRNDFLSPIELLSITETPRWIMPSPDDGLATQYNADQALRLSFGHGPEFFKKFKEKINNELIKVGLKPTLVTWEELDKIYFE